MKKILVSILLLKCFVAQAQIEGTVKDSLTNEVIPYVNLQCFGKEGGTSANEIGVFILPEALRGNTVVISATGYETKKLVLGKPTEIILLKRQVKELDEIVISSKQETLTHSIDAFSKKNIGLRFALGDTKIPYILAKNFNYLSAYSKTPYLKTLKIETRSEVKSAKFNLKLYKKQADGSPGEYLYNENIIVVVKKGRKINEIDLSAYNILFPEEGFFAAVELLIIKENKYKITYTVEGSNKKITTYEYAPAIGALPCEDENLAWIFRDGAWVKKIKNPVGYPLNKNYHDKYNTFAMELVLSN